MVADEDKKIGVILTFRYEGTIMQERIWAIPRGELVEVANIPFRAHNLALGDLIQVVWEDDQFHFHNLIQESGNSTVQIRFQSCDEKADILENLESFGCSWEQSDEEDLYSANFPLNSNYRFCKNFLEDKKMKGLLDYREACLSSKHKSEIVA